MQQTDLAATLAVGLGLPVPRHSVGSLLFPVVEGQAVREQLRVLHLNAVQLSRLLQENVPSFKNGESVSGCRRRVTIRPPLPSVHLVRLCLRGIASPSPRPRLLPVGNTHEC